MEQRGSFSVEERDQRWARVRTLMARDGIDLIVCFPLTHQHGRSAGDARYLTQLGENSDEVTVAFPIEGSMNCVALPRRCLAIVELVYRYQGG